MQRLLTDHATREWQWIISLLIAIFANPALAQSRTALVIGNSAYQHTPHLANPVSDASAVAAALRRLEFNVVEELNLDRVAMEQALYRFGSKAEQSEMALVFFAGHGVQVNGRNYLLPVDARLDQERDLRLLISLEDVIYEASQAHKLGLVILDACRDNPLARRLQRNMGATRSAAVGRGLARVIRKPANTLVAFATEADQVALDTGVGGHSPYTAALLQYIEEQGLELRFLFGKVRDTVLELTQQQQEPTIYGSLGGEPFYLAPPQAVVTSTPPVKPTAPVPDNTAQVMTLLRTCEAHIRANRLSEGVGGNAVECYKEVLRRDSNNAQALEGLSKVADRYAELAERAFKREDRSKAEMYLERLARLNPEHPRLTALQESMRLQSITVPNSPALPSGTNVPFSPPVVNYMHLQEVIETVLMEEKRLFIVEILSLQDGGIEIDIPNNTCFDNNSYNIKPSCTPLLNKIVDILQQYHRTTAHIIGNTDSLGSDQHNLSISQEHAVSIASFFAAQGISPERLFTEGRGGRNPRANNTTPEGRTLNQRTEIILRFRG